MISLLDIKNYLSENDLEPQEVSDSAVVITVKGNAKLKINVALAVGQHTFRIESFAVSYTPSVISICVEVCQLPK